MIELSPLFETLIGLLAAVLLALGTWAVNQLRVKLGIETDHRFNDMLNDAVHFGVEYAVKRAKEKADGATADSGYDVVNDAANYVIKAVPNILKRYGITDERVRELVTARLNRAL